MLKRQIENELVNERSFICNQVFDSKGKHMFTSETIPIPNPQIIGRIIDNEAVLVMPQQGKVKVLNEVGAAIWHLMDGQRNVQQIVKEICRQFDIDQAVAETDTLNFIAILVEREIISTANN